MKPGTLADVGFALYGHAWQGRLARDIGVNDRTVRRWYAGEVPIPTSLKGELLTLAMRRRGDVEEAIKILKADLT